MSNLETTLRSLAANLQFRRVNDPNPSTIKITGYDVFCANEACKNGDEPELAEHYEPGQLPEEYKKPGNFKRFVEVTASFFQGTCKAPDTKYPYSNPKLDAVHLTYSSLNNSSLDLQTGKWSHLERKVVPRNGDLICGIVSESGNRFNEWFICTEQFHRMILLLRIAFNNPLATPQELESIALDYKYFAMHIEDYCENISEQDRLAAEEVGMTIEPKFVTETLRRNLMRGNQITIGSAVYKPTAARNHNGTAPLTFKELCGVYTRSRCESYARRGDCVHLYAAILTLFFYKEQLTLENVPKNIVKNTGKEGVRNEVTLKWVVPDDFFTNSFNKSLVREFEGDITITIDGNGNVVKSERLVSEMI